ncbi:MAG: transporter [Pseudonocardiales bacterium]|nr:transporter [Pseudonocardiales bacterium]
MRSAPQPTAPRGGRLLRHRDFLLLWAGQSTSDVGTAVSTIVLPLIAVVYLHATPLEVGALAAAEWVPWLLIGLPAGVWVDRSRCRPLMLACDAARALLIASVPVAAALNRLGIAQLFIVAFLTGIATVIFQVAYLAYLPSLVERDDLVEGNAKLQGSGAVAAVVGPGLGGVLVQAFRAPFALIVDAASYVVSAAALLAIRAREPAREPGELGEPGEPREPDGPDGLGEPRSVRREIGEGGRYVAADPILRVLTIAPALCNFFFTGFEAIAVLFLVRSVHLAPSSVGLLMGVVSLGSVLGAALARPVGRRIGTSRAVWMAMLVTAPFGLLIPLTTRGPGLGFFVAGNVVLFVGILVYNVTVSSFRQAYCPPHILGRVVASMRFVLFGTIPLGALAGGALAAALGARTATLVLLAGNLLPGLVLAASPLRRMRDLPDRPATPAGRPAPMAHT